MAHPIMNPKVEPTTPEGKFVFEFIAALGDLKNPDKIGDMLSDSDFRWEILPASLGKPPLGKQDALAQATGALSKMMDGVHVIPLDLIEGSGRVFIHAKTNSPTKFGFPYANEYSFCITVGKEGGSFKITHIKEFLDSLYTVKFLEDVQKATSS